MALKIDESGTAGTYRILRQQIGDALELLSRKRLTGVDVHEARKQLRKARATLRLMRGILDSEEYRRSNVTLRDAARPLGLARDASVLPEALSKLTSHYDAAGGAAHITALRRDLLADRARAHEQLSRTQVGKVSSDLRALQGHIDNWHVDDKDWDILGRGLGRTYRKGRTALATAQTRATDDLHEWRKQVKYLRYQLHLLEPLWPGVIGELADQAHKLSDYLGDDHDLAVLEQRIRQDASTSPKDAVKDDLLASLARSRTQLQDKSLILGARLYEERPRDMRHRFGEYWKTWRSQPR